MERIKELRLHKLRHADEPRDIHRAQGAIEVLEEVLALVPSLMKRGQDEDR